MFALASEAHAISITAEATINWVGFTYTTTGTLIGTQHDSRSYESAFSRTTSGATTSSYASYGLLYAKTTATPQSEAEVRQGEGQSYWFYGTGVGQLVYTLPYHLSITSDADYATAAIEVMLLLGPGYMDNGLAIASLTLDGQGAATKDGTLTVFEDLYNPYWGPLVGVDASAHIYTRVPDGDDYMLLLGGGGVLLTMLVAKRRFA